ncbi:MAG: hypothetical protein AAGE52_09530 [Myxococcota bacterium]
MKKLIAPAFLLMTTFGLAVAAGLSAPTPLEAQGNCCRYVIRGCDQNAKVCVPDRCGSAAERRARQAFEGAYSCRSSSTASYIGTCSNERCDIDLR